MHAANQHARTLRLGDLSQAIDQLQLEESEEGKGGEGGRGVEGGREREGGGRAGGGEEAASLNFLLCFLHKGCKKKEKKTRVSFSS